MSTQLAKQIKPALTPSNYTPGSSDQLEGHLEGIDSALAGGGGGVTWTEATTRHCYVSSDGNDGTADGSPWLPYATLSDALSDNGDNCTYYLQGDEIEDDVAISLTARNNVAIIGAGSSRTTIKNDVSLSANYFFDLAPTGTTTNITIKGVKIENTYNNAAAYAMRILLSGASANLSGLHIEDVHFKSRARVLYLFINNTAGVWDDQNVLRDIKLEHGAEISSPDADLITFFYDCRGESNHIRIDGLEYVGLGWAGSTDNALWYGIWANNDSDRSKLTIERLYMVGSSTMTNDKIGIYGRLWDNKITIKNSTIDIDGGTTVGDVFSVQNVVSHHSRLIARHTFNSAPGSNQDTVAADELGGGSSYNYIQSHIKIGATMTLVGEQCGVLLTGMTKPEDLLGAGNEAHLTFEFTDDNLTLTRSTGSTAYYQGAVCMAGGQAGHLPPIIAVFDPFVTAGVTGSDCTCSGFDTVYCRMTSMSAEDHGYLEDIVSIARPKMANLAIPEVNLSLHAGIGITRTDFGTANWTIAGGRIMFAPTGRDTEDVGTAIRGRFTGTDPNVILSEDTVVSARWTSASLNVTLVRTDMSTI